MAAAEELRPGDGEEETVSAKTKVCARGGGGDSRAGCEGKGARMRPARRTRTPHERLTCFLLEGGSGGRQGSLLKTNCRIVIGVGK